MLESDYLMRMVLTLTRAIVHTVEDDHKGGKDRDPKGSAELVENAVVQAAPIDGGMLLGLAPQSMVDVLRASGAERQLVEFMGRSLYLESEYLRQAGDASTCLTRLQQARALAQAYEFDLGEGMGPADAMRAYEASLEKE